MQNENNSYRIRTQVGSDAPNVLNVKLNQTFEFLNILSLKIGQKNLYKMPAAPYGVICGRVMLGGKSFGIQNAKVSVFIPKDGTVFDVKDDILYTYSSVDSVNYDGIRYNLLPSYVDNVCHQNVGTMFEKEYVLDNNDVIRIFDSYYTYTTTTNNAGDYFIYGVPVGQHTLHVDVDLSDIGKLSVRPHDMIGQGYNIDQFESPNKFKADKNLNILPQIKTQNKPVYVYPFWGDTTEDDTNAMITRADIEIDYKFEPTAVFIGSIVTDKGSNSISHKCVADDKSGKMSELITGEGKIEMIRKTFDGKVEQFSVKGNRLIDGDGVWCYQVPMNLDYVCMDEFGNIVPTDNPEKGIPTRARVRFRISLDENPMDDSARKRARFLVPNNPRLTDDYPDFKSTHNVDYEFGTFTKEENYRDMFWNNVYTVKSYVPRLQKRTAVSTKKFTGIKTTNHAGDNNPIPYNNLSINMGFVYRFLCVLLLLFIYIVAAINTVMSLIGYLFIGIGGFFESIGDLIDISIFGAHPLRVVANIFYKIACWFYETSAGMLIDLGNFCDDGNTTVNYIPGPGIVGNFIDTIKGKCHDGDCFTRSETGKVKCSIYETAVNDTDRLINCVQNALAQDNEVTSFDFQNDWINGVLYAPLWYRKIKPKRRLFFGLIKVGAQDDWCDGNSSKMSGRDGFFSRGLKLYQTCAQRRNLSSDQKRIEKIQYSNGEESDSEKNCYGLKCHKRNLSVVQVDKGIIIRKETKYGEYVYYYKSVEYSTDKFRNVLNGNPGDIKILFATDLVLLGSLNDCDEKGVPQFFKHLNETTYQMPPDLLSITWQVNEENVTVSGNGDMNDSSGGPNGAVIDSTVHTEYTGADWGNAGRDQWYHKDKNEDPYIKDGEANHDNGGVFYGIDCNWSYVKPKSCVNLSRVCEFGVTLDQSISFNENGQEILMPPDGYISYDEIYNPDARAMFATMNGNRLRERQDPKTGFPTYDFNYLYPENFDGTLYNLMYEVNSHPNIENNGFPGGSLSNVVYKNNYKLEANSDAYLIFRYGFDKSDFRIPFYNNDIKLGWFTNGDIDPYNRLRFPRYENSFYFYFGLKSGKTAIDKFRRNFYAECTNDPESESSIVIDYVANSWCLDTQETLRDGYISFDLSNVDLPCDIVLDNKNNSIDYSYSDINTYKIYIGLQNSDLDDAGYVRLYVDSEGKQCDSDGDYATPIENGYYSVTIIDANGASYKQNILFDLDKLKYDATPVSFTLTNNELIERFPPTATQTTERQTAFDTTQSTGDSGYAREIGGYIIVSNITNNGEAFIDNFRIRIEPYNVTIPGYHGSDYAIKNGVAVSSSDGVPPFIASNGEFAFGVPLGGYYYTVTVTEYCPLLDEDSTSNEVLSMVFVSEPEPFRMLVNGIDTELLTTFATGYVASSGIINAPYSGYNEADGVRSDMPNSVRGWLNIQDVGVSALLSYPPEGGYIPYSSISGTINALQSHTTDTYHFTDEYTFEEDDVIMNLDVYSSVPSVASMNTTPKYIRVKRNSQVTPYDPFDEVTWIYQYNTNTLQYNRKEVGGQPVEEISVQEYFETNEYEKQCQVIRVLNEVIQKRLDLVDAMIKAFWMYDPNQENKNVSITYQTNETPVKTLVYYIPDQVTRINVVYTSGTSYMLLDENKEENTITSFANPTITKNTLNSKPIFFKYPTNQYKLPPYCGIKNRMEMTVPSEMGTSQFYATTVTGDMTKMFGFHIIDKRPFTMSNIWLPLVNHPIYWPDVENDTTIDTNTPSVVTEFIEGGYFNLCGCISGYFYNGFSTSNTQNAQFLSQKATNDIGIYTITVNGDGEPDEFAIPTNRLMYRPEPSSDYVWGYNDFKKQNTSDQSEFDGFITTDVNTDYRYISYIPSTRNLTISDKFTTFSEPLYGDKQFGIPEDTVVVKGISIKPSLGINDDDNIQYTVIDDINPIYSKVYNNDPILPSTNRLNMKFRATLPSHNLIIPDTANRVYFIGYSEDGKYRGISPTYEVSKVDVDEKTFNGHPAVRINFDEGDVKDYYLRKYPYYIILSYTEYADGESFPQETVSIRIQPTYDTLPSLSGHRTTEYYTFTNVNTSNALISEIYIKDVTGIRRKTNITIL